ncbi:MAG TPA: DUF1918 domain-containing protein [Actinomycetota bacterium]|jgi:hypothetical protein|nr:DUF1918 domain-containing protein [Actinomycetota bacterium]
MVRVGDRVEVESEKVGQPPRQGTVVKMGKMLTIRWDDGKESAFLPTAGSLKVVTEVEETHDPTR